jgi:hypothetical protein
MPEVHLYWAWIVLDGGKRPGREAVRGPQLRVTKNWEKAILLNPIDLYLCSLEKLRRL